MTEKERELAEKYLAFKQAEKEALMNANKTQKKLSTLAPHKIGEIIKWHEVKRKRVGGSWMNPIYEDIDCGERQGVLRGVEALVYDYKGIEVHYRYEFAAVKKDGGVSANNVRPVENYEWTGEIHKEFK